MADGAVENPREEHILQLLRQIRADAEPVFLRFPAADHGVQTGGGGEVGETFLEVHGVLRDAEGR